MNKRFIAWPKAGQGFRAHSKTTLSVGITLLFIELSFLPAQICEYKQDTKQQVCTVSNASAKIIWHVLKFLGDNSPALTVLATLIIAYFTYTLWDATHGLRKLATKQAEDMQTSLRIAAVSARATQKAARAADISAQAAVLIDLPILHIERMTTTIPWEDDVREFLRCFVPVIDIKNYGRSPAFVNEVLINTTVGEALPDTPIYTRLRYYQEEFVVDSGIVRPFDETIIFGEIVLPKEQLIDLVEESSTLFIYGYVLYRDLWGVAYKHGFIYAWVFGSNRFLVPQCYTTYRYQRKVEDETAQPTDFTHKTHP